ncbi:MAG TPA: helix-hairpin-helix domain-containing protein [Candidatus Thermoplasmatota archaeon]
MLQKTIPPSLRGIPNVGPATALDLQRLGFGRLEELRGKDPDQLYELLCRIDGVKHDICVRDVFAALIDQAAGRPAKPWWHYSRRRLAQVRARRRA